MIYKRLNDIDTLHCSHNDNELLISGTDEQGEEMHIIFDAINFLHWIDRDTIEYIKEQTIKHIKEL